MAKREARPLRELRRERLLTLEGLAKLAGVGKRTVQHAEVGRPLRPGSIRRLADALGVAPEQVAEFPDWVK